MRNTAFSVALLVACGGGAPSPTPPHTDTEVDAGVAPAASSTSAPASSSSAPVASSPAASASAASSADVPAVDPELAKCGETQMLFEQKIRPEIKKCFFAEKVKNPKLSGNVKIVVHVSPKGEVAAINIVDRKELGDAAVACMTKVVKDARFDGSVCKGKIVEMPEAFGNAAK